MIKNIISVICPVYNVEEYLNICVDSILNQTYPDFELLLIDDGSTDNSGHICDDYAKQDDRVIVVHTSNGGAAAARNVGIEKCNGKYIAFMDSDDFAEPTWLETLHMNMANSELSVVGYYIDNREDDTSTTIRTIDAKACFHEVFDGDVTTYLWNKLFLADIIKENHLHFDINTYWGEDAQFIAHYCEYVNNAVICSKRLYHYVQREGSIVHDGFNEKMLGFLHGYEEIQIIADRFGENDTVTITICVHCQSLIYRLYKQNKKDLQTINGLKNEISKRRHSLIRGKGRTQQKAICLLMIYSVPLACAILDTYKRLTK